MKTILKSEDFKELLIVNELPDEYSNKAGIKEFKISSPYKYKDISNQSTVILLDGIYISYSYHSHPNHDVSLHVEKGEPHLEMRFQFNGSKFYYCNNDKVNLDLSLDQDRHYLFYLPELKGRLDFPRTINKFTFEIELSVNYLKRVFNDDWGPFSSFGKLIENNQPAMLGNSSRPISYAMKHVIKEIIECKYTGVLKKIYLEGKVLELLAMQAEQINSEPEIRISKDSIERLEYVKELIVSNIHQPLSIMQLSELSGLNGTKLKKTFKEMYGNTLFGYMTDIRMERAKKLIMEGKLSIAEISDIIGYKNPQHFTSAFKKKFGYLPKELKR